MNKFSFPSLEEIRASEWYQTRPGVIKSFIEAYPLVGFYKFKDSGKICQLFSYNEDTLTITVQKVGVRFLKPDENESLATLFNIFDRGMQVFGVSPSNLQLLTPKQTEETIKILDAYDNENQ